MSAFDTPEKAITRAWSELTAASRPADAAAIAERTGLHVVTVTAALAKLRALGALPADTAAAS